MIKALYTLVILSMLMTGCSSSKDDSPKQEDFSKHIIYDQDHFDPDWIIGVSSALALHKQGTITIDAIVLTGHDVFQKAGLKYQTIVQYYGFDIPIGINHNAQMRTTPDASSKTNPYTDPRYVKVHNDITEFPSDGLLDSQRVNSINLLEEVLRDAEDKSITYIIGGHLQNLAGILERDSELFHAKVVEVVINTGGFYRKSPEMNLGEGRKDETGASIATRYVLANLNVPLTLTAAFEGPRPGDVYLTEKLDSPMAFLIAVPTYGTYGDHGISDNASLFVGVYGMELNGHTLGEKRKTCIRLHAKNYVELYSGCNKEHFVVENFPLNEVGTQFSYDLLRL